MIRLWGALPPLLRQFIGYGFASAAALAFDWALMVALTELAGLPYLLAGGLSFTAGAFVAYVLSVAFVFDERRYRDRRVELALFVGVGAAALLLNQVLLYAFVEGLGLHYAVAKAPVAIACFLLNFTLRKMLVFSAPRPELATAAST